jgi:hypothetical protein
VSIKRFANNLIQAFLAIDAFNFILDTGNVLLQELTDVGEYRCASRRNAILSDGFEKVAEGAIEIGAGAEFAGTRGERFPEFIGIEELLRLMGVKEGIHGMLFPARHGAGAKVRECKFAGGAGFRFWSCGFVREFVCWFFPEYDCLSHDLLLMWDGDCVWWWTCDSGGSGIPASFKQRSCPVGVFHRPVPGFLEVLILRDFKSFEPEVLILGDFKSLFLEVLILVEFKRLLMSEMQKIEEFLEVLILGRLSRAKCTNGWI